MALATWVTPCLAPAFTHWDSHSNLNPTSDRRKGTFSSYTPTESSRVESHESCLVKSPDAVCFIFVRLQWSGVMEEMDVQKLILLIKDHEQFTAPRFVNTGSTSYLVDDDVRNNKTTAPLTTVIVFLGLLFKVFIRYFWRGKTWQQTFNWLQIKDSVMCLQCNIIIVIIIIVLMSGQVKKGSNKSNEMFNSNIFFIVS